MRRSFYVVALASMLSAGACSDGRANRSQREEAVAPLAAGPAVPVLTKRVTDLANLLSIEQERRLSVKLGEVERATGHQIVIVTVPTLGGRDPAAYARTMGNRSGIGRKGHDDGVIVLVAPAERQVRIAVGLGLERTLSHEVCQRIIDRTMVPQFRRGDLSGGIEAGTEAIIDRLS